MEKAERQKDMGSSCLSSLCMVMLPPPPFPELTHGCYYSGKKLSSSGQKQGFFSSAPTIVWLLC